MKTPNCDRLAEVHEQVMVLDDFLTWMCDETGLFICDRFNGGIHDNFAPTSKSFNDILMMYFKIDKKELEKERRAILEAIRNNIK